MSSNQTKLTDFWKQARPTIQNKPFDFSRKSIQKSDLVPNLSGMSKEKVKANVQNIKYGKVIAKERNETYLKNINIIDSKTDQIEEHFENSLFNRRIRELITGSVNKNTIQSNQEARQSSQTQFYNFAKEKTTSIQDCVIQIIDQQQTPLASLRKDQIMQQQVIQRSQLQNNFLQQKIIQEQPLDKRKQPRWSNKYISQPEKQKDRITTMQMKHCIQESILNSKSYLESNIRYFNGLEFQFQNSNKKDGQIVWINSDQIFKLNPQWLVEFYTQFI